MTGVLVSAATGAMGSLMWKLRAILTEQYKQFKEVRGDIQFLKDELEVMYAFLMKMSDVEEPDEPTKLRMKVVREMSYDIEDNIDKFMVLVEHGSNSEAHGMKKLIGKCKKLLPDIKTRHKIANEVKDIKKQLQDVSERFSRYKIDESSSMPAKDRVDPRLRAVYKDATELVGIDGPRDELVKWLNEKDDESLKFLSIVGYGGLGKTTLANQIHVKLGPNFGCQAFVSISRKPNMKDILRSMLSQFTKQDLSYPGFGEKELIDKIRGFLADKRYFVIIDDIWDVETWQTLKCVFVHNRCGSRILITTRKIDVAESCSPSREDHVYKMLPLGETDSKKLFFKRIFGCEERCPLNLMEASKDILKKCGGLPLAINAISSLLAITRETEEEWNRVRHSIRSSKAKCSDIETMSYILSLSYFDLPHHLRSCLLYLSLFPEDAEISRRRLVHLWISEGFVRGQKGHDDLVELGEEYFYDLIDRSLIQPVNMGYDGTTYACRVHDTILDFLIDKASEENFCTVLKNQRKPDSTDRRLSFMGIHDEENVAELDLTHARSIFAFGDINGLPSLGKSKSLRVLDYEGCKVLRNHHINDIGKLYQLRYLNIPYFGGITKLPSRIGELQYLETLVLPMGLVQLPESTTRLRRLARLFVGRETKLPDGFGNLVNLQEVERLDAVQLYHTEELGKLKSLRKLSFFWNISEQEGNKWEKLVSSLCKLDSCSLRFLRIYLVLGEHDGLEGYLFLPALNCIREVTLWRGKLCRVMRWLASLANLQKLVIEYTEIGQQDIDMIGQMPNLLELDVWWMDHKFSLIISSEGFQHLQSFTCRGSLRIMFEVGAMPKLRNLDLYLKANRLASNESAGGDSDFCIQHLSSLARLTVEIYCDGARAAYVEAAEEALKSMAETHPNRPTLEIMRRHAECMLPDEPQEANLSTE